MLTTRFRVWLQDRGIRPDWTGVVLVDSPKYDEAGWVEVIVKGNGHDLRRLIAERQDIFAAYIQMMPQPRNNQGH